METEDRFMSIINSKFLIRDEILTKKINQMKIPNFVDETDEKKWLNKIKKNVNGNLKVINDVLEFFSNGK